MKRHTYDAEIKVRLAGWLKQTLEAQAEMSDLELSDVVRRALKDYALRKPGPQQTTPGGCL